MAKIIKFPTSEKELEKDFQRLEHLMEEYDAVVELYREQHNRVLELGFAVQQATYSLAYVHGFEKIATHYPHLIYGASAVPPTQMDFEDVFQW
jgi:hypothetical protein